MSRPNPTRALADADMTLFWQKVDQSGPCWMWLAATDRNGYGLYSPLKSTGAPMGMAHRYALANALGRTIPSHLDVDHLCKQPSCVNPEHLELVSHRENLRRANAHRTHCAQGHPRTAENWVERRNGHYYCRACSREVARRRTGYYERRMTDLADTA